MGGLNALLLEGQSNEGLRSNDIGTLTQPFTLVVAGEKHNQGQATFAAINPDGRVYSAYDNNSIGTWSGDGIIDGPWTPFYAPRVVIATIDNYFSTLRVDGYIEASGNTGTVTIPSPTAFSVGCLTNGSEIIRGKIGEVLAFDRALLDSEAAQLSDYLMAKWGVAEPPPKPNHISGLVSWYDANDLTSSPVNTWPDKSGHGWNATKNGSYPSPAWVSNLANGYPAVRFGPNAATPLDVPTASVNTLTASEIFVVLRTIPNDGSNVNCHWQFGYVGDPTSYPYPYPDMSTHKITESFATNRRLPEATAPAPVDQWHIYNVSSAPGDYAMSMNGQTYQADSANTVAWGNQGLRLGSNWQGIYYWNGEMAEVIIYDHKLTPTERADVMKYLGDRYAIAHPLEDTFRLPPVQR
jgi:hypothetical protein